MESSTGSELIVTLAWRSAEVAAIASAAMLLFALGVRRYLESQKRLHARVIQVWRPLLARAAMEEGQLPALLSLSTSHLPYVMEEWNALHVAVRGRSAARLNEAAIHLGLDVAARRLIHTRQVGRRILAIRTLGHLRDPSSWKPLQEQLASPNALVSFYAAAALVQIDAQRAMPGIMNQLAERESWPAEAMARLLVDVGADIAREPVRALMLSLAPAKVPPLLPWLAHVDAVLGSEVAIELLRRHPDEAGIVAAALLVVLDPAILPELARFADSEHADIRKNLAVACGRLGALAEVDVLLKLLCDRVWWVRYRAGQALLRLPGMDDTRLDAIRTRLTDPYARDMLSHVRAEAAIP
ncbi:MAG: HEAT repeat domain-containing protein [Steroidobacteraceae bacterium]